MQFVLSAAAVFVLVCLGAALLLARFLQRLDRSERVNAFRIFLVASLLPHALHAWSTYRFSSNWINLPEGPDPLGSYPGAQAFLVVTAVLGLGLLLLALWLTPRLPLAAALLPAAVFTGYFHLAFGWLEWQAPGGGPLIDNVGVVWLFLVSTGATVFLAVLAWSGLHTRPHA